MLFFSNLTLGQDQHIAHNNVRINIPEVALLDLEPVNGSTVILSPISPTQAGQALDFSTSQNSSIWLNYSSIVSASPGSERTITAMVESEIPSGLKLKLNVATDAGNGSGKTGTPLNGVILSSQAQPIINGIGSCYTGDGTNNGHLLTYIMELDEDAYGSLSFDMSSTLNIVYTISEGN